jgi:MFS family permease
MTAGLASTAWLLIGARTAQGIGAAAVAPAALALVMQLFPPGPGRAGPWKQSGPVGAEYRRRPGLPAFSSRSA